MAATRSRDAALRVYDRGHQSERRVSAEHVQVDLQDGFADDVVEVRTEGRLAHRRTDVTTRHQIGLATSFEFPVAHLPVELEVVVTSRGLRRTVRLDAGGPMHLGVSERASVGRRAR